MKIIPRAIIAKNPGLIAVNIGAKLNCVLGQIAKSFFSLKILKL
jgi:hypothetical protein